MQAIDQPIFVFTSDIDWAHDECIEDLMEIVETYSIKPLLFATHESSAVRRYIREERIELGVHPNFLPGSTHGSDTESVVAHIMDLYPEAATFRSHCFVDSTPITRAFWDRGMRYDSNLCLYIQEGLRPLCHQSGMLRFPVFWEDDVHWTRTGGDWRIDDFLPDFLTPGLKIINVHPLNIYLNTPDSDYYNSVKVRAYASLGGDDLRQLRHRGTGTRTFVIELMQQLSDIGHRFHSLAYLYELFEDQAKAKR